MARYNQNILSIHHPWYDKTTASLDQIDNTKGYTKNNVQWVHKTINWCKLDFSVKEFIQMCEMVVNHQKGNSQK